MASCSELRCALTARYWSRKQTAERKELHPVHGSLQGPVNWNVLVVPTNGLHDRLMFSKGRVREGYVVYVSREVFIRVKRLFLGSTVES